MIKKLSIISVILSASLITACGGGGGGGSSATLAPFVNFSSISPNTSISIPADSQEGTYTFDTVNRVVTSFTPSNRVSGASYASTYDSQGNAVNITITSGQGTVLNFSRLGGDFFGYLIINNDIDVVISQDETRYAFAANPYANGFEYQSFGIWATGAGTGTGTVGEISAGAQTSPSAIPISGSATYLGITGGRYLDTAGNDYFTSSNLSATANFATRSLSFATTNTARTADLLTTQSAPSLNMTGTLSYSSGSNEFSGAVTTVGGLVGTAAGRFYGPSAQEIGGTFRLQGSGVEGYVGAFGAKR